tara:strand:- start:314 stop:799 length:486 start_codon:yes stop_codon:yes gene_type:complete
MRKTKNVGVYARPPSTSTPEMAEAITKALLGNANKKQIKELLKKNESDFGGEMILLASAGKSKRDLLGSRFRGYDPIVEWNSGFLYMAFSPTYTNVVNAVNDLNMLNIAHVWLMQDGSVKAVTDDSMKEWGRKWTAGGSGMDVPVHWVDDKGELLPKYRPA